MRLAYPNKGGVRYRYYVSNAIVQQRKADAGSAARVPAPEIENLVLDGVRTHLTSTSEAEQSSSATCWSRKAICRRR